MMTDYMDKGNFAKIKPNEMDNADPLTIEVLFKDWEDLDVAQYYLACLLGILRYDDTFQIFRDNKGLFWTQNRLSDMFYKLLKDLEELKVLERNDDGQYRYCKEGRSLDRYVEER